MNEQEVINLIKDKLRIEVDSKYDFGFRQILKIELKWNNGDFDNPEYEVISESEIPISNF